jgi:hypothetical protein
MFSLRYQVVTVASLSLLPDNEKTLLDTSYFRIVHKSSDTFAHSWGPSVGHLSPTISSNVLYRFFFYAGIIQ